MVKKKKVSELQIIIDANIFMPRIFVPKRSSAQRKFLYYRLLRFLIGDRTCRCDGVIGCLGVVGKLVMNSGVSSVVERWLAYFATKP